MEIEQIFQAKARSVGDLLRERGQAFYVPAYQRPYAWDTPHLRQLMEDISHGVTQLVERPDAITFIGTLIVIHDTDYVTVNPLVRPQVPGKVLTVIDGQQRLTTLLLLGTVLHDEIRRLRAKYANDESAIKAWIVAKSTESLQVLEEIIEEDMSHGDNGFRYYPRITRAFEDQWSRKAGEALYRSPAASLLHAYGNHYRAGNAKRFIPSGDSRVADRHKYLYASVTKGVGEGNGTEGAAESPDFPTTPRILKASALAKNLFNENAWPEEIASLQATQELNRLFRILVFARYMLNRVAVTLVTTKAEDYAFEMFEALNTTGEPLTAIETFAPKAVEAEGLAKYEGSPSREHLDRVKAYAEQEDKSDRRQKLATGLLIPFALAESGEKLSTHLSDQRRYLRDRYEKLSDIEKKRQMSEHLADAATFMSGAWPGSIDFGPRLLGVPGLKPADRLCLAVLKEAKHDIVLGPLFRFYSEARIAGGAERANEMLRVIRSLAAFFGLWRGAHGGTAGIDGLYRKMLKSGMEELAIPPMSRAGMEASGQTPSALQVVDFLRASLEEAQIVTKSDWVKRAKRTPIYRESKVLTRFLILCASEDTVPDPTNPGLQARAKAGVLPLLTYEVWRDESNTTIEHIAPQSRPQEWSSTLYEDPTTVDRLGNLILLPQIDNSALGKKPWATKRFVYKILSAPTKEEADSLVEEAGSEGIFLTAALAARTEKYLSLTTGIGDYPAEWDLEIVEKRSTRMAELAWEKLTAWLTTKP